MLTEPGRTTFLDIDFDDLSRSEVVARLRKVGAGDPFRYIVTPNVDHVVRLQKAGAEVRAAYTGASMRLCDSRVLARIASFYGIRLEVVPGSDLVEDLFRTVLSDGDVVSVVGGEPTLIAELARRWPDLTIVHHQPPMGLATNRRAMLAAAEFLAKSHARFHLLAVGSPQQEVLALEASQLIGATGTAMCIGAAMEFLVGEKRRAPRILQRAGLEWAFRLSSEPRRLARRYLIDGPRIFRIAHAWSRRGRTAGSTPA